MALDAVDRYVELMMLLLNPVIIVPVLLYTINLSAQTVDAHVVLAEFITNPAVLVLLRFLVYFSVQSVHSYQKVVIVSLYVCDALVQRFSSDDKRVDISLSVSHSCLDNVSHLKDGVGVK